jgi:hypothetical protein
LRENTRLNRRVDYLEAALRDVSEQEAKGKMAPAHECRITKILRVIPFWLFLLACLALPVFLYLAAREGGLLQ